MTLEAPPRRSSGSLQNQGETNAAFNVAFLGAGALSGCATSTGILPAGDTYTLTERFARIRGGGTEAQRAALTEANAFCVQQGRVFVPGTMNDAGNLNNPYGPRARNAFSRASLVSRARSTSIIR